MGSNVVVVDELTAIVERVVVARVDALHFENARQYTAQFWNPSSLSQRYPGRRRLYYRVLYETCMLRTPSPRTHAQLLPDLTRGDGDPLLDALQAV